MKAFIFTLALLATLAGMVAAIPHIHAWERANDYPFGYLCDVYRSCPWHR